jgi:hypothetical protein
MSEPTYRVRPDRAGSAYVDGPGFSLYVDHDGSYEDAKAVAERIASLLTQDDARLEREAMRDRCEDEGSRDDGPVANRAWVLWETACREAQPLDECRRLEAAYRATQEQGPRKGQWSRFCSRVCACRAARANQPAHIARQSIESLKASNRERSQNAVRTDLREAFGDLLQTPDELISVKEAVRRGTAYGRLRWYVGYRAAWAQRRRQLLDVRLSKGQ